MRAAPLPPVGAVYSKSLWIPLLGTQAITVRVLPNMHQRLTLTGTINVDETFAITMDEDGHITSALPPRTDRIIRRFRSTYQGAQYVAASDCSIFSIRPALGPAVRVRLDRLAGAAAPALTAFPPLTASGLARQLLDLPRALCALVSRLIDAHVIVRPLPPPARWLA